MEQEVRVKVSTQELVRQAGQVTQEIDRMAARFAQQEELVRRTSRYWIGEAGERRRAAYLRERETVAEMLRRLREYPDALLRMAGVYQRTESAVTVQARGLKGDAIH